MQFTDQIGQVVKLKGIPQRIVSLVPSQTELLFDLGLGNRVVGCTKFCIHPGQMPKNVARIGGTKNPNLNKIASLNPDLVIANKEENNLDDINHIKKTCAVWVSDINTIESAINMIREVGALTGTVTQSEEIAGKVESQFKELKDACTALPTLKVAYFIWKNPIMIVGTDNFIDSVLALINLYNPWSFVPQRYPEISLSRLKKMPLDYVLLSTEPFPFKETDCLEIASKLSPTKAILVDGEMFSWYGSRMLKMKDYLLNLRKSMATDAA